MRGVESIIGTTIAGRYRVVERIGQGGMGAVYAAVQEPLGRSVALKVLKTSYSADDVAIARFKKEAAIVATLNHPNIVTLHDFGETSDGLLYIVMEHLRGRTLGTELRAAGPLPWRRTLPIVEEIVRALAAAHDVGVIHRDLKLENIMLVQAEGERDIVKILDFGVAKSMKTEEEAFALTATDSSPGTPGYMSPELARGVTNDVRSDFYALGVVWFELLAGRRPYVEKNAMDVFLKQMTEPVPRVRAFANVPASVDDVVAGLLEKEPARRPKDAAALLDAVLALEPDSGGRSRIVRTSSPPAKNVVAPARDGNAEQPSTSPTSDAAMFMPTRFGGPPIHTDDAPATIAAHAPPMNDAPATSVQPPTIEAPATRATSATSDDTSASGATTVPDTMLSFTETERMIRVRPRTVRPQIVVAAVVAALLVPIAVVAMRGQQNVDDGDVVDARVNPLGPFRIQIFAPKTNEKPSTPTPTPATPTTTPATTSPPTSTTTVVAPIEDSGAPKGDVEPVVVEHPGAAATVADADTVRRRLASVSDHMRDHSLLADDVRDFRALSADAKDALDAGRVDDAAKAVDELEKNLGVVHLTDAFIRAKIARVEGGLSKDEAKDASVQELRTEVHERFGARDLAGANAALNRLWLASLKLRSAH